MVMLLPTLPLTDKMFVEKIAGVSSKDSFTQKLLREPVKNYLVDFFRYRGRGVSTPLVGKSDGLPYAYYFCLFCYLTTVRSCWIIRNVWEETKGDGCRITPRQVLSFGMYSYDCKVYCTKLFSELSSHVKGGI